MPRPLDRFSSLGYSPQRVWLQVLSNTTCFRTALLSKRCIVSFQRRPFETNTLLAGGFEAVNRALKIGSGGIFCSAWHCPPKLHWKRNTPHRTLTGRYKNTRPTAVYILCRTACSHHYPRGSTPGLEKATICELARQCTYTTGVAGEAPTFSELGGGLCCVHDFVVETS